MPRTADAAEFHNQSTHIWFTASEPGGGLELEFDFGMEIDLTTLYFWNYTGEGFDVDNIDFTFFNTATDEAGALSIMPALGSSPGILAEEIPLAAPLNVRFVTSFLSGSNGQVDFQNIGFNGEISAVQPPDDPVPPPVTPPPTGVVPEPSTFVMVAFGLVGLATLRKRKTA